MLTAAAKVGQDAATTRHHGAHVPPPDDAAEAAPGHASAPAAAADAAPSAAAAPSQDPSRPRPKQPLVLVTTALTGEGIPELLAAIDRRRATDGGTGASRVARADAQVWAVLRDRLRAQLDEPGRRDEARSILAAVARHELDPFAAADRLLALATR
jgi:putative protein kinase ArgK-like GTPase of G3E family